MEVFLGLISVFSSSVAAVFGLGGGLILISLLPDFLPAEQIIPIHGVTQLASNSSRAVLVYRSIAWKIVPKFLVGGFVGSAVFAFLLVNISTTYIPLFIGTYILLSLWSKSISRFLSSFESYYLLGFLQTGLGIMVGSTGHLTMPLLLKELQQRDKVVATSATFMAASHGMKLLVYGGIGFHFRQYAITLVFMVAGAFLGSYIGTFLRGRLNDRRFSIILKLLLTVLAIRMICVSLLAGL